MKALKFAMMFVLILTLITSSVFALQLPTNIVRPVVQNVVVQDKYLITDVEVNGMLADQNNNNNVIYVERGQRVPVEVFFKGTGLCSANEDNPCYDVRLRVYLGGYEFGVVEATSGIFQVLPGVNDHKILYLEMPEDLEASELYTLNVELFDDDDSVRQKYYLRVEESRHDVNIYDVIFNPNGAVRAGEALFTTVRVENLGDNTEESVKVTVSVPELGIRTSEYVDLLVTEQEANTDGVSSSRRRSATTNDLLLMVPESATAGSYEVVVTAEFNRGHDVAEKKYNLQVTSPRVVVTTPVESVRVNVASTSQALEAGKSATFAFAVSNMGQEPVTVTFDASGADGWGTLNVAPGSVTVAPNSVKDVAVTVFANDNTDGTKVVSVRAKVNGNVVSENALTLNVSKHTGAETVKKVLVAGFIVLLVILVILAIVLVVRKLTSDDENGPVEGQTYY